MEKHLRELLQVNAELQAKRPALEQSIDGLDAFLTEQGRA